MVDKLVVPVVHPLLRKIPDPPLYLEFNFEGTMGSVFIKRVSILVLFFFYFLMKVAGEIPVHWHLMTALTH